MESRAFETVYPEMTETARAEGNQEAAEYFRYALESERIHARFFQDLLDALEDPDREISYFVCPICGLTVEKMPPSICPVCGTRVPEFKRV